MKNQDKEPGVDTLVSCISVPVLNRQSCYCHSADAPSKPHQACNLLDLANPDMASNLRHRRFRLQPLLFARGVFVLNPDLISMANNGTHDGPSPLVRLLENFSTVLLYCSPVLYSYTVLYLLYCPISSSTILLSTN
jgi:hypothetical protein